MAIEKLKIEDLFYLSFRRNKLILRSVEKYTKGNILDVGTGRGHNLDRMDSHNPRMIVGLDIVFDGTNIKGRLSNKKHFVQGDCTNLSFYDNQFDFILSHHVIEHINNFEAALGELYRVLKKDGILVLGVPTISTRSFYIYYPLARLIYYVLKKIKPGKKHNDKKFLIEGKGRPCLVLGSEAQGPLEILESLLNNVKFKYLKKIIYCWAVTLYFSLQNNIEHKIKLLNKDWKKHIRNSGFEIIDTMSCGIFPLFIANFLPVRFYRHLNTVEDKITTKFIKNYVSLDMFYILKK